MAPVTVVLLILLLLAAVVEALAATHDVPATYATIQTALDAAAPGDSIHVDAGTYFEKLSFTNGGTAGGGYVTLQAAPGAATRPVIDGTGVAGANMILIDSKSYVRVIGFEIVNNLGVNDGSGVRVIGSGSHIEIRDNVIHEMRGQHAMGITVYGTAPTPISDLVIDGNEIFDCDPAQSEALTLNGNVTDFEITDNYVHDVDNIAIDCIGGETDIQPDSSLVCRNGVIRGNRVERARSTYGGGFAGGIYVDGGGDVLIENNLVTECDLGIEVGAENAGLVTSNVVVRNNVVFLNDKAGLVFGGFKSAAGRANDNVFRGNTLYRNNVLGRSGGGEAEIWVQYAENNVIDGNIVYAGGENVFVASFGGSTANSFDFNLYFSDAGAGTGEFTLNGTGFLGLDAWRAGTGNDAAGDFADPGLRDPDAGDFHIDASSPAFDAGDPGYVPAPGETDIDGAARLSGARIDAGADEASCGDSVLDPGEACDDGNQTSGDGCDANCTLTACGNGIVTPTTGEQCDDGNTAGGDCCDGVCAYEVTGSACDDTRPCTRMDQCDGAGICSGADEPDPACLTPLGERGSAIRLRNGGAIDSVNWKWGRGPAVSVGDLGDPTLDDGYTLCVFVDDAGGSALMLDLAAPAGAKWEDRGTKGYRYRDSTALPDGIRLLQLRPGIERKARLKLKAKGAGVALDPLAVGPAATVTAELRGAHGGCFAAEYSAPFKKNDTSQLKDTSD